MAYSHYQHASPTWGTNQYQFGPPPTPNFQSQPSWGGMDFYRAHAATQDPSLFDHAWGRVRDYTGLGAELNSQGVSTNEARHWHHRAYGLGELNRMHAADIGHAAAYEAHRTWIHNRPLREPLNGDTHRQREALIGLAVGEAKRLISFVGREMDRYAASETAAATASIIFYEGLGDAEPDREHRRSRSRTRFPTNGSSYGDPYAFDDAIGHGHHRHRSQSRPRSHSRPPPMLHLGGAGAGMSIPPPYGSGYPSSMPPGTATSYSDHSSNYGSFPGHSMPINMPTHDTPYPQSAIPLGSYPSQSYQPQSAHSYQPHSAQPYQTQVYQQQPYQVQPVHIGMPPSASHHRGRSLSTSYPQQTVYAGAPGSANGSQPAPQVIVIKSTSSRQHKHHHGHHHRHRSSSRNSRHSTRDIPPYQDHYPDNYRRQY